jgi:hypothetical protein
MLSRLVLGVHFLVDVIAGGVLGGVVLCIGLERGDPGDWFGVAAIVALIGGVVAALSGHVTEVHDAAMSVGSAMGGVAGWRLMRRTRRYEKTVVRPLTGTLVVFVSAGAWTLAYLFGARMSDSSGAIDALALLAAAILAAVAIGLVVGLPALLSRAEYER